jgi:hypothetical protein
MRMVFLAGLCATIGATLSACGTPVEAPSMPERAALVGLDGERVFSLRGTESVPSAPTIVFDHQCAGVRYRHTLRDEIVLRGDGTASRRFEYDRFADDRLLERSTVRAVGRWTQQTIAGPGYFSGASTVVLDLVSEGERPSSYLMMLRRRADGALTTLSPVGGSCPGSANDARHEEFAYTSR